MDADTEVPEGSKEPPTTTIRRARYPWRVVASVAGIVVATLFLWYNAMNPRFEWDVVFSYLFSERILQGLWMTLFLTVVCQTAGILIGAVLALMQISGVRVLVALSGAYIWVFRGLPLLVQIIFWFNISALYPDIGLGLPGSPFWFAVDMNALITPIFAACLALSLNEGAYMAEIVRAGLLSVDKGQIEAAHSLGLSKARTMARIVIPQAMRFIIPPTGNQTIGMLKTTSLVSTIAVVELLYAAQIISATTFQTIPILITISIWYLFLTTVLTVVQGFIERHYSRGYQPTGGPRRAFLRKRPAAA